MKKVHKHILISILRPKIQFISFKTTPKVFILRIFIHSTTQQLHILQTHSSYTYYRHTAATSYKMAQCKKSKRSRSEDNIGYTEAAKRPKIMPTAAERAHFDWLYPIWLDHDGVIGIEGSELSCLSAGEIRYHKDAINYFLARGVLFKDGEQEVSDGSDDEDDEQVFYWGCDTDTMINLLMDHMSDEELKQFVKDYDDESIAEDIRANKGWEDDDEDDSEEEDDDSEEEEDKEEEDQTNGHSVSTLTRCKNTPVTIPTTMPVWKPCSFEEAYGGGEDTFFRLENMGGNINFAQGGVWKGLTNLDADASAKFLRNLSKHFLKTEIAYQLSLRPLHFKDGSVRVVGWPIADSMVNYC